MKKILLSLMALSTLTFAFSMGGMVESVDKTKAMNSVDKEQAMNAITTGDISVESVKKSVDGDKAIESVDKEKLMKSMF